MPRKNKAKTKTTPQPRLVDDFIRPAPQPEVEPKRKFRFHPNFNRDSSLLKQTFSFFFKYRLILPGMIIVVAIILIVGSNLVPTYDPVPASIRRSVSFNIYYPNPNQLPVGYTLNTKSFESSHQAILYTVSYGDGQKLIFTVQAKPSNAAIQSFYRNHLPLTIPITTSIGTAELGALNNETVISLPTNTNAWILMTAPLKANQNQLKHVLQSMSKAS